MRYLALLILAILPACSSPRRLELGSYYFPLVRVEENAMVTSGTSWVVGGVSYVHNLDTWMESNPQGSLRESSLEHDRVISRMQMIRPANLTSWLERYQLNKDFRWAVEKMAWGTKISFLVKRGYGVDEDHVADILSGSRYEYMVPWVKARDFVVMVKEEAGRD